MYVFFRTGFAGKIYGIFRAIFRLIDKLYLYILFFAIMNMFMAVCRYLSIDINGLVTLVVPDYGIYAWRNVNTFKRIEIIRYVVSCVALFGLFLGSEILRKRIVGRNIELRYKPLRLVTIILAVACDFVLRSYNSHVHGYLFWSLVGVETGLYCLAIFILFRSSIPDQ